MGSDFKVLREKIAFQSVLCARSCPPDSLLVALERDERLNAHIVSCPFCQERIQISAESDAWRQVGKALTNSLPESVEQIIPGQLRRLSNKFAGWGPDNKFYNPPVVLLLEKIDKKYFRVMQTHAEPLLRGPDDIPLGEELGFAEPWNTYAIHPGDFAEYLGMASDGALSEAISALAWDFKAIDPQSVLFAFRSLELNVGSFMALQSMKDLLIQIEGEHKEIVLPFCNPQELRKYMSKRRPDIKLSEDGQSVHEILARSVFPEVALTMAAAAEHGWRIGNLLIIQGSEVDTKAAFYKISLEKQMDGGLLVAGRLRKEIYLIKEVKAWWATREGPYSQASDQDIDPEAGVFRLFFPGIGQEEFSKGKIALLFLSDGTLRLES